LFFFLLHTWYAQQPRIVGNAHNAGFFPEGEGYRFALEERGKQRIVLKMFV
jgi:hypothetical protein